MRASRTARGGYAMATATDGTRRAGRAPEKGPEPRRRVGSILCRCESVVDHGRPRADIRDRSPGAPRGLVGRGPSEGLENESIERVARRTPSGRRSSTTSPQAGATLLAADEPFAEVCSHRPRRDHHDEVRRPPSSGWVVLAHGNVCAHLTSTRRHVQSIDRFDATPRHLPCQGMDRQTARALTRGRPAEPTRAAAAIPERPTLPSPGPRRSRQPRRSVLRCNTSRQWRSCSTSSRAPSMNTKSAGGT